jgi:sporulation protein YlmC with PRC-barrel domain
MVRKFSPDNMVVKQAIDSNVEYLTRGDIAGKRVVDSNARIVGNVKDISFSLIVEVDKGNDINIEVNDIAAIGDLILIKPKKQSLTANPTTSSASAPCSSTPGLCMNCNHQNMVYPERAIRFCTKCGSRLQ